MRKEGKIRNEKKHPPHLILFCSGATPYSSECRFIPPPFSLNSAAAELQLCFHIPVQLFSARASWNEKAEKWEKVKNQPKTQPPKLCACSFANKPSLPQRPCWVWAMLPAALFRKVPFASPSARPLTAFSQKCRASFCLPEIAGHRNKSTFNE